MTSSMFYFFVSIYFLVKQKKFTQVGKRKVKNFSDDNKKKCPLVTDF